MEATSQNSQKSGLCLEVRTSKRSRDGEKGRASVPGAEGLAASSGPRVRLCPNRACRLMARASALSSVLRTL